MRKGLPGYHVFKHVLHHFISQNARGFYRMCAHFKFQDVCPLDPEQDKDDPLVTTLILRVFMMDSMLDGEELQITLRTTACVEYHDCNPVRHHSKYVESNSFSLHIKS